MPNDPAYILEIEGLSEDDRLPEAPPPPGAKWIGVQFDCCGVYQRVYRNRRGTAYTGHCPRCGRPVRVRIGPGGTRSRMFRAT